MAESDIDELQSKVEKAKNGDKDAFAYLYKSYFTPIYRYIYFRVSSKIEVEDLTQDVFLKAFTSFRRYSYSDKSPLAYFYTIARNTVIDYYRKRRVDIGTEDELSIIPDESLTPDKQVIQEEDKRMIHKNIRLLTEDQQEVIILRFIEEFSTREISEIIGKSEEAVRQLQSRGIKLLRKYINYEL